MLHYLHHSVFRSNSRSISKSSLVLEILLKQYISNKGSSSVNRNSTIISNAIIKLEESLKNPRTINADTILAELQALHSLDVLVPLPFFSDVSKIFSNRNDAMRTELLLYLSKENFARHHRLKNKGVSTPPNTRSNPSLNPYDSLVSNSIGNFIKAGHTETALQLWIRMTSTGYSSSKSSLEILLEKANTGRATPPLEFIDKIHSIMCTNLWNQSPLYYSRILNVLKQHFRTVVSQSDKQSFEQAYERLQVLLQESNGVTSGYDITLESTKVKIWIFLSQLLQKQSNMNITVINKERCLKEARESYQHLFEAVTNYKNDVFTDLTPLLNINIDTFFQSPVTTMKTTAQSSIPPATTISTTKNTINSSVNYDFSILESRRKVGSYSTATNNNNYLIEAHSAVMTLLIHLASLGHSTETIQLLDTYIQTIRSNTNSISPTTTYWNQDDHYLRSLLSTVLRACGKLSCYSNSPTHFLPDHPLSKETIPPLERINQDCLNKTQEIFQIAHQLHEIAQKHHLSLGITFYTAWVAALPVVWKPIPSSSSISASSHQIPMIKKSQILKSSLSYISNRNSNTSNNPTTTTTTTVFDEEEERNQIILQQIEIEKKKEKDLDDAVWQSSINSTNTIINEARQQLSSNMDTLQIHNTLQYALIELLCRSQHSDAILKAYSILETLHRNSSTFATTTSTTNCNNRLPMKLYTTILTAATFTLSELDLLKMIKNIEAETVIMTSSQYRNSEFNVIEDYPFPETMIVPDQALSYDFQNTQYLRHSNSSDNVDLLIARLCVYSRLRKAFLAVQLLTDVREAGGEPGAQSYRQILYALRTCEPKNQNERDLIERPRITSEWLCREMLRDGLALKESVLLRIIQFFIRVASKKNTPEEASGVLQDALRFVEQSVDPGIMGHPPLKLTEHILSQVIQGYCACGLETQAIELIAEMDLRYGMKPTAISYAPIIHSFMVDKQVTSSAENLVISMTNRGITLSEQIVDSFLIGHLLNNNSVRALDTIQELYNQYNVKPSISAIFKLLDHSLLQRDVFEARRIVVVMEQIYGITGGRTTNYNNLHIQINNTKNDIATIDDKNVLLSFDMIKDRFQLYCLEFEVKSK